MSDEGRGGLPRWMLDWGGPIVLSAFALCSARLLLLIHQQSVNVLFWDQWDFFEALFQDVGWWDTFRWQHGPHRQGVGFWLTRVVAELSGWSTRADAFACGVLVSAAAAIFVGLRRRLLGALTPWDVAIPVLVLTPAQYGIFVHTVNAAHGAAPLALLGVFALALTIENRAARDGAVLACNFLLIHTGFGMFVGVLTPFLFLGDCARARRLGESLLRPVAGLAVALGSAAYFFLGYTFDASLEGFEFPSPLAVHYPRFMALMLANVCGVKGTGLLPTSLGSILLLLSGVVVLPRAWAVARGRATALDQVIVVLIGFSLLFCLNAAVGRVSMGFPSAQSTRYVPLVVPLFLGLLLHLGTLSSFVARGVLQTVAVVGLIAATFPMRTAEATFMQQLTRGKQRWAAVYVETRDIDAADRAAGLKVYPWAPETTHLHEKLAELERRELNLFTRASRND